MLMSGAIALGTLFAARGGKHVSSPLIWINVTMMILVFSMMARTGLLGGEIRHSEIHATPAAEGEQEQED
jgi:hypothetical protein